MKGLVDSTLREGEQTPGVFFSSADKGEIAALLLKSGIEEIELGVASKQNRELPPLITKTREMKKRTGSAVRLALWSRCRLEDVDWAAGLKPDVLSLSIPVSDLHIRKKLEKSGSWVLDTLSRSISQAVCLGIPYISLGLEDASRAEPDFLVKVVRAAELAGAQRIRFADTVGLLTPDEVSSRIESLKEITSLEIGGHCHNDFGMATANTVSALQHGADWADVTVLGLGERAGNARLEEVAGFISLSLESGRYQSRYFRPLCERVAESAGMTIAPGHPVVGSAIFTCETGLHLQGLHSDPATYEPYSPDLVGAERSLLIGAKSGRRAVTTHCRSLGLSVSGEKAARLTGSIRKMAGKKKRALETEEIRELAAGID